MPYILPEGLIFLLWKVYTNGKHGRLELRDLGFSIRMRGKAKQWGNPTTLTIVYRPSTNQ
ncbi:MAG: hypothetical protein F6J89_13595 [Symploca sp. SIO1C4]|uniref:Uncharacterized protein n=1 Tax=Symploca sp. SIO1C4 TaxID=2607765 RepID=A0A6B3NH53_9CYAN|nr:hypothetical protein [Symploca sp. SIO1C4]